MRNMTAGAADDCRLLRDCLRIIHHPLVSSLPSQIKSQSIGLSIIRLFVESSGGCERLDVVHEFLSLYFFV